MIKEIVLIASFLLGIILSITAQEKDCKAFVEELLSRMTLEEKIGQMIQYSGFFDPTGPAPIAGGNKYKYDHIKDGLVGSMLNVRGAQQVYEIQKLAVENSRLGIPLIFGFDVIHGFKTIMPIPLAEAASWDLELIEKSARIAAAEAAAAGINWTFAPMVDISRDARWGRVMEGAGEDPYLGVKIAEARVSGFQSDDLSDTLSVAACAKHFAGYGFVEAGREYNTVDIGSSTLYNTVLPPFKATVDAGVQSFMNSFNELNGIPTTADKFLQRELLKAQWGFDGFVVSDWATIRELITHGFAENEKDAALKAVQAGCDMDMESHIYGRQIKALVEEGKLSEDLIDDAAGRILRVKYNLGLFENPYLYCNVERENQIVNHDSHRAAALEIAQNSIVLLKNDKNILPLAEVGKKIAVIGHLASDKNSPLGNWRLAADDNSAISVMEGLEAYKGNNHNYSQGVKLHEGKEIFALDLKINEEDRSGMDEAKQLAADSDIVIMVLGEHGYQSGEGRCRTDLGLPGLQQELLESIFSVNDNIVLVTMSGRPLVLQWAHENIPSILHCWQLGQQSGHAIASVLYGDVNPSGKLPMSFPRTVGQVPIYYNYKRTGRPGPNHDVFWSHYIDEINQPLYPFGYGLSYTQFEYSNLNIEENSPGKLKLSVMLKNTGEKDGAEVVQLYIRDRVASITRPVKELKAFEKVFLKVNESKKIEFELTENELGFYNNQGEFIIEDGDFEVMLAHLALRINFKQ